MMITFSSRVKDGLKDTFSFATLFLAVPNSRSHGDDWCNKPIIGLFKLENRSPAIIVKEKNTVLSSFLIDFFLNMSIYITRS